MLIKHIYTYNDIILSSLYKFTYKMHGSCSTRNNTECMDITVANKKKKKLH